MLLPLLASGYTQIDKLYYDLNADSKTAEVAFTPNNRSLSGDITIPETVTHEGVTYMVTSIGASAFDNCYDLVSVTLPKHLTSIGKAAFWNCTGLTSVKIPEGITSINENTFYGCKKLATVTLPSTITSIGKWAFAECPALFDVYCYAKDVPSANDDAFVLTYEQALNATLHVPANSVDAYKQSAPWPFFGNVVTIDDTEDTTPSGDSEAYAVLTDNDDEITTGEGTIKGKTLTFYYDNQKGERDGMSVVFSSTADRKWGIECDRITKAVFDGSFANCTTLTSTKWWFLACKNLKTITGITNLKTDNVTDMTGMFYGCSSLTSLDLSSLNTSSLKIMYGIFQDCFGLKSINLTNFKTDKVENMGQLFLDCTSLESLDVSGFNTDEVGDMFNMFRGCSSLKSLDLSNFNTKKVRNMAQMFRDCSNLTSIFVAGNWSTEAVTESTGMFQDCTSLVGGASTAYDANHIDKAYAHIDGGSSNPGYFTDKNATPVEEDVEMMKISSAGQMTFCSEYDLDFTNIEGLKAYTATGYNRTTGTIWLTRVNEVPAKTGLLLIGNEGVYKVPKKSTTCYYMNMFVGTLEPITIQETNGEYTNYYLSNGTHGVGFYKVDGTQAIAANRAYLPLLKDNVPAGTRFISLGFEDGEGTTGIKEVKSGEVKGEKWFTLQGQRVDNPGKGLYIKNGKKVLVK